MYSFYRKKAAAGLSVIQRRRVTAKIKYTNEILFYIFEPE